MCDLHRKTFLNPSSRAFWLQDSKMRSGYFRQQDNNFSLCVEHVLETVSQPGMKSLVKIFSKLIRLLLISMLLFSTLHAAEFKDPTEPLDDDLQTTKTNARDVLRHLNLHEIVTKGQDRWAVINNTIVREGDVILGERVIQIGQEQVTLTGESGEIQLQLIDGKPIKEVSR